MAMQRYNKYQYDTNPRKLEPEYKPRKNTYPKKTTAYKNKINAQLKLKQKKNKIKAIFYLSVIFAAIFAISYRNTKIDESFTKNEEIKNQYSAIQKENEQLEVSIENSMNLNNIEQSAKVLLGMQKLTPKQTVRISLPKKDHIEQETEEIKQEDKEGFFDSIFEKIEDMF